MSDSLLRLAEELLRLGDRLVDNPIIELSASLYFAYIQRVMSKLEDMADFSRTVLLYETMSIDGVGALSAAMMRPAKYRLRRGR